MMRIALALLLLPVPAFATGVAPEYEVLYGRLRVMALQSTARTDAP